MGRRLWISVFLTSVIAAPTAAQIVVIDPANLAQAVLIAQRTLREYEEVLNQYTTLLRMAQSLGDLDRYRVPIIAMTRHDPSRWVYGRPWIQGLNTGDPRGTAYYATALPLLRPDNGLSRLTAEARRTFESQYATVEISDSVAMLGGHQVALVRGDHDKIQDAVQELELDVLNRLSRYHEMTAVLDKISAGELLARRQDSATNQLLSHALEQLLARTKRLRDTEAATINMQLVMWRDGHAANTALVSGTGDALRSWRQP
jgi:hypothetical protein